MSSFYDIIVISLILPRLYQFTPHVALSCRYRRFCVIIGRCVTLLLALDAPPGSHTPQPTPFAVTPLNTEEHGALRQGWSALERLCLRRSHAPSRYARRAATLPLHCLVSLTPRLRHAILRYAYTPLLVCLSGATPVTGELDIAEMREASMSYFRHAITFAPAAARFVILPGRRYYLSRATHMAVDQAIFAERYFVLRLVWITRRDQPTMRVMPILSLPFPYFTLPLPATDTSYCSSPLCRRHTAIFVITHCATSMFASPPRHMRLTFHAVELRFYTEPLVTAR